MERSENFASKLYPKKFLSSEKNNIFSSSKKCSKKIDQKKFEEKNLKKSLKISNFEKLKIFDFSKICRFGIFFRFFSSKKHWSNFFFRIFLNSKKYIIFSELRNFWVYDFDAKFSDLSIYDVFRAFGAWQIRFPTPRRQKHCYKTLNLIELVGSHSLRLGSGDQFWG